MSTEVLAPENTGSRAVSSGNSGNDSVRNRDYTVAPAVSIIEEAHHWLIQADMPGVTKDNARINTEDNYLTITGERRPAETSNRQLYKESRDLSYRRTFELPSTVDVSKVTARLENGVLSITLPKVEKVLPRTIEVTD